MNQNRRIILSLLGVVLLWKLALVLVGMHGALLTPYDPTYPYVANHLAFSNLPVWLYSWAGFDGVHYLRIAANGYADTYLVQVFFPIYPLLIGLFSWSISTTILVGQLISILFFTAALYRVTQLVDDSRWSSVAVYLLFPTSLFFGAVYTESIFLFFVLSVMTSLKRERWLQAAVFAGLATGTRLTGVFLLPAVLWYWYQSTTGYSSQLRLAEFFTTLKQQLSKVVQLVLVSSAGILVYMTYLQLQFDNALLFITAQKYFNTGREELFVLLPQVLWRGTKIIFGTPINLRWLVSLQELTLTLVFLVVLLLLSWRARSLSGKKRTEYIAWLLFSWGAFLLPTLTGTLASMPRYLLVCFPVMFWFGGKLSSVRPSLRLGIILFSAILLVINLWLFIQGQWVA